MMVLEALDICKDYKTALLYLTHKFKTYTCIIKSSENLVYTWLYYLLSYQRDLLQ